MKNILIVIIALIITSCSCREISDYNLTEYEGTLIPFDMTENLQFVDEEDLLFSAVASEKVTVFVAYSRSESCDDAQRETQQNALTISKKDINLVINLQKNVAGDTSFEIDNNDVKYLPTCENFPADTESLLRNYSSDSFDFQNVFVFEPCEQEASDIRTIVYSSQNGIEFIKFENEGFLKLVQ